MLLTQERNHQRLESPSELWWTPTWPYPPSAASAKITILKVTALTVIKWQLLCVWLFQASLSISGMSILIKPDRCRESQDISKGFWRNPFMFCFCLCKNLRLFCLLGGRGGIPQSSKTSNRLPKSHLLGGDGMGGGQVWGACFSESCTPSLDIGLCGRRRRRRMKLS